MFKSKAQVADYLGLEYFDPDLQKTTSAVYYQGGGVQVQYEGDLVEAVRVSAKMIEPSIDKILEYLNVKIDANNLKYTKTDASYSFEIPIGSKSVYCSAAINPQSKAIDNIVCSAVNR
ncbi:MAG: hypothetical protein LBS60_07760 [Deltaproteobacteria bacterium]|nr:hypothetical protein [Deltaproteobacteria bacterium]